MIRFGLTNLRRLRNVEPIALKPITLLVGRNSGGKSTFLRTFPLIRQSLMTRTSSPILWYGDLVDFGAFDTSLSRQADDGTMSFTFSLDDVAVGIDHPLFYGEEIYFTSSADISRLKNATVRICLSKFANDKVRISTVIYNIPEIDTTFQVDMGDGTSARLFVNGRPISFPVDGLRLTNVSNSLLPDFKYLRDRLQSNTRSSGLFTANSPLFAALDKFLRNIIGGRVGDKTITHFASRLTLINPPSDKIIRQTALSEGVIIGRDISAVINERGPRYIELMDLLYALWFPLLTKSLSQQIRNIFGSTLYIGPMRARSERYYRYQELAVSEIDPDGKNFPMFLNSLTTKQIDDFSSWTARMFGYGVSVSKKSGHLSINLIDNGRETNIVDVGYGVSQILPVLGQIWWAKARTIPKSERAQLALLAIEQPELHLHPAHQALLADALVGEAVDNRSASSMHYVVETHSETLVNRFGEFIAAGRISPSDVQVVLFDADEAETTRVRTVNFDENGILVDWPYGFFQPSMLA